MSSLYLRLLHSYANLCEYPINVDAHDITATPTELLLDGRKWYSEEQLRDRTKDVDDERITLFAQTVESLGECPLAFKQLIAYCLVEKEGIDTFHTHIHTKVVPAADFVCLIFESTHDTRRLYVFYAIDTEQVYTLSNEKGIRYRDAVSLAKDYLDDSGYKEFCIRLDAVQAMLPENDKYKDNLYYNPKLKQYVSQYKGDIKHVGASTAGVVELLCSGGHKDEVLKWLKDTKLVELTESALVLCQNIINQCTSALVSNGKSSIDYSSRNGYRALTLRSGVKRRVLCLRGHGDYVVLRGMSWQQVPSLAKQLDKSIYSSTAISSYMLYHNISDPVAEMLRLLDLAGVQDAEKKILSVLKDLGEEVWI